MLKNTSKSMLIASGIALSMVCYGVAPASAEPDEVTAQLETAAEVVSRVDPQVTTTDTVEPTLVDPVNSSIQFLDTPVVLSDQLTTNIGLGDGVQAVAGETVDYIIRDLSDSTTQILAVMSSEESSTTQSYQFTGKFLEPAQDGSVLVRESPEGEPVAMIDAPWARDGDGKALTTEYQIQGDTLVQTTAVTDSTVYPVVADPSVNQHWWGWSVDFTWGETNTIANGNAYCTGLVAGLVLTGIGAIGTGAATIACAALVGTASIARGNGQCVSVNVVGAVPALTWTPWIRNC
ncbi:hypothetical protein [Propionimicrobium sp. PCR01-08-3]|uniref:hypothetical protein n=1 Tax=Propionimicrobium sp. PCR01-08-3 TaxID=3052086 RepID=UPI00255D0268|nr:hypothetical protein [Propionimicrobium sp. PCR01-08-3]WIY83510.1 hypothetical protein QQ658_03910 [Propionimicrobium sp. PCR01-08-3]